MLPDHEFRTTVGNNEVIFRTGKLAEQAGGAVRIQMGDSVLFGTATMSRGIREGLDFFPLSVDYEEKLYAAGRIPGSFFRREGRPTTQAILTARLTDRPLRPLFPKGMRNEVQIIISTLSSDSIYHLDIMSVNVASAALTVSDIPWNGPVGAVRVGYIDGQFVVDPTIPEMENSQLDLRLAGSRDAIIMVEAGANGVSESMMVEALEFGHEALQPLIDVMEEMREAVGKPKNEPTIVKTNEEVAEKVYELLDGRLTTAITENNDRHERGEAIRALRDEIIEQLSEGEEEINPKDVQAAIDDRVKNVVRRRILDDGIRPDGRDYTTIRSLSSEVGLSPRAHGSGLFRRGETQVLSLVALGTMRDAQKLDGLYPEDTRRFMHHYNFPPFSTGETWPMRGPKRREIGHGALGQTAMEPVIPSEEDFPYAIRVVSEVLSSNGSTSQGSICAAVLALMDCGVPIKSPVAGVAMGLISDGEKYAVLTDIQGMEDHLGDMDFKVAGTAEGITALQMDIKISGLSKEVMAQAMEQARVGRLQILDSMMETLSAPREELSEFAPRMMTVNIDPEKIGAVIGKGGATIRTIQEAYEVSIDIQEDGTVFVAGVDGKKAELAVERINAIAKDPEVGEVITGKVVRTTDFGAFVEIAPGTDGLVHISQLSSEHVRSVEDAVQIGDEVMVMITDVTPDGKVRLSRKAVLEGWTLEEARENDQPKRGGGRGGNRGGGRGGNNRGGGRGGNRGGGRDGNRGRRN